MSENKEIEWRAEEVRYSSPVTVLIWDHFCILKSVMSKKTSFEEESPETAVASVVHKNIKTMLQLRQQAEERKGLRYVLANQATQFMGSFSFVLIQVVVIVFWISVNSRWAPESWKFDPFPYFLLSTIMAIQAILIAIFILMNQNHMKDLAQKSDGLDVQINLLTEHEVTQIMSMVEKIYSHLNIKEKNQDLTELKKETSPEKVLQVIEQEIGKMEKASTTDMANPT